MHTFTDLYAALDETTKTNAKIEAMARYFAQADAQDAAWAVYFLSGRRPKRLIGSTKLRDWARELADIPDWLFGECYDAVGDSAETIALLLPSPESEETAPLHVWVEERLLPLGNMDDNAQRAALQQAWLALDGRERFVWNKLITGALRVGVSQRLLVRALAQVSGVDATVIAHRLMGTWEPTADFYTGLIAEDNAEADISRPYPFFLAYPLEDDPTVLGDVGEWQLERKWDGIRAQLIRRRGQNFVWSRGEELITERFPELADIGDHLPDGTVLDGEVLPWRGGHVLPFAQLQRRIGRKKLSKKLLADIPAVLLAYDLLEWDGEDVRERPLAWRRAQLAVLVDQMDHPSLLLSELVEPVSWVQAQEERDKARDLGVEGLMIKRKDSSYQVGRRRGDWWKWKIDPYTVDAVLIYAQRGSGRRAGLYTDYTFAVWDGGELVPFAKAYSGLTDEEIREVDRFVRQNTKERFGPVRSVTPELVFELAFENIQKSTRHKSGVAVRFPRIVRWRRDKKPVDADTLEMIQAMVGE
ncbi:MAG: ATP-dependent DNA ligase [Caldilineaceae bacterium]